MIQPDWITRMYWSQRIVSEISKALRRMLTSLLEDPCIPTRRACLIEYFLFFRGVGRQWRCPVSAPPWSGGRTFVPLRVCPGVSEHIATVEQASHKLFSNLFRTQSFHCCWQEFEFCIPSTDLFPEYFLIINYRPAMPFGKGKNIWGSWRLICHTLIWCVWCEKMWQWQLLLSQSKKYQPSGNLKFNNLGIFKSLKLSILEGKILLISLKLNFSPNFQIEISVLLWAKYYFIRKKTVLRIQFTKVHGFRLHTWFDFSPKILMSISQ